MKKHKKRFKHIGEKPVNGVVKWFEETPTKGDIQNSLIKSGIDIAVSTIVAPLVTALGGRVSYFLGAGLNFAGHYVGDKTGALRNLGSATMGYAVAKSNDLGKKDLKSRLTDIKDDILRTFHLREQSETPGVNGLSGEPDNADASEDQKALGDPADYDYSIFPEPETESPQNDKPENAPNNPDEQPKENGQTESKENARQGSEPKGSEEENKPEHIDDQPKRYRRIDPDELDDAYPDFSRM